VPESKCSDVQNLGKVFEKVAINVLEELEHIITTRKKRAIIISGPTGAGKTALSIKLAQILGGEIISADSVQIYRGMDIGTAKISKELRAQIPHHLIDIRDITEPFHVVDFYEAAKAACQDIIIRGKVPIVVGGTGFYLHALLYGPPSGPPADQAIRCYLQKEYDKFGIEPLFQKLQEFDPIYAASITPNDAHKVLRALEIIETSGKPVSSFKWKEKALEDYFDFRCWFIHRPRALLYQELEQRCDDMLKQGLLKEVVELDRAGIRQNRAASQAIGYKQSLEFLDTAQTPQDYELFVQTFKTATRHLAKRQFTWFRKEPLFQWVDLSKLPQDELIEMIISDFQKGGPSVMP
jgi:tRNA dimethylallyltransferase